MKREWRVASAALGVAVCAPAAASATITAHPASVCRDHAAEAGARSTLDVEVIGRVMRAESGGDSHAISPKGAIGCMQIMPATWADLTARYALGADPFDARLNMIGGALYLAELTRQFGPVGAFAAYNAGPARYARYLAGGAPLPAESVAYVARLRGDTLPDASLPARVRWQVATLFLPATGTATSPTNAMPDQPSHERRAENGVRPALAFTSSAPALATLFPLSRDAARTQPR